MNQRPAAIRTPTAFTPVAIMAFALLLVVRAACPALAQDQSPIADESPADRLVRVQRTFTNDVRPMLKATCGDCHWGENEDAGLNLERYETIDQLLDARKKWQKVLTRVAAREMPPEDSDPLSDDQHTLIIEWIDELLNSVDCTNINAGSVTIRRLNRTEYRNTVRDLLGIDYVPSENFPGDDVGYGFDNIADVLSLPPRLMEKYLDAAEVISARAIVDPEKGQYRKEISGIDFRASKASEIHNDTHMIHSNGGISHSLNVPIEGKYRVTVAVKASHAGDDATKIGISIDGEQPQTQFVPREDQVHLVSIDLRLRGGKQRLKISLLNDVYEKATETRPAQDRNLFISGVRVYGPLDAHGTFQKTYLSAVPPKESARKKYARQVIEAFGRRAWRRPLTDRELRRLMALYRRSTRNDGSFYDGLRICTQAMLVSSNFLFKVEQPPETVDENDAATPRQLTDYQLATRLSYFLWSTTPDAQLFALADKNKLRDPKVLRQQVERMLADPKSIALVENFGAQWLHLPALGKVRPDPDLFPGIDQQMRKDMATETKLLLQELINTDASILNLLSVDYSFINQRLAEHYGISEVEGNEFRKVSLADAGRRGIISHASILTLTSNPTRTSPVKRGKWIMENLLGDEPPPPDPNAVPLENQKELTGTTRQRMIQHREDPNCAVCHKVMDELGFALENYDAVGRWRTEDEGQPVDSRGELPDGTKFAGAEAMQQVIQTKMRQKFVRCLTEKMLIYALGRGLEYFDECTLDKIIEQLQAEDYRFSELISQIVLSKPFREVSRAGPRRLPPSED